MSNYDSLCKFILKAKANCYVGDGKPVEASRPGSHDLSFVEKNFLYLDSYFGGSNFIGEETVYENGVAVWGMNYYGRLIQPEKISAAKAGGMIKASLSKMYANGRFLGGWEYQQDDLSYFDTSDGDLTHFTGYEWIEKQKSKVYELYYHGGLII